ncbi:MAG: redoxin domain-containing protein [Mariprofundus sp.]|nr:redoxin domain-containing protein [Mariprofundus sp.]
MKTPAYLVLRLLSVFLVVIGITLLFSSGLYLLSHEVIPPQYRGAMFVLGALFLLVGSVGPVRILYKGAKIPVEIKRAIILQAITMPLSGLAGDKKNSSADQAFLRWTRGREGVPVGSKAPDGTVITMQGEAVALSSFFGEKLLVLNFASYSCPHHRKRISEIQTLMKKWQSGLWKRSTLICHLYLIPCKIRC